MNVIYNLKPHHIVELCKLYKREWWTNTRTLEETQQCVTGSQICIGLVNEDDSLEGFARVLTDFTFKALIFDVIVSENSRKCGLGDKLINLIKDHPQLSTVKSFELYCLPELQLFYKEHGFTTDVGDINLMRCTNV
ncbi:GNAT family N-acetyltransferase [Psychromonas arctica]|uniref:GNAT family N-acetyltransferase n=1 Tax=Psychromonas arctica TaxID=168275 RepID=UPI002FCE6A27